MCMATVLRWFIAFSKRACFLGALVTWDGVRAGVYLGISLMDKEGESQKEHIQGQYLILKSAPSYYHFCMGDNEVSQKEQEYFTINFHTIYKESKTLYCWNLREFS